MNKSLTEGIDERFDEYHEGITLAIHNKKRSGKTITCIKMTLHYLSELEWLRGVITNVRMDFSSIEKLEKKVVPLQDIKYISEEEWKYYLLVTDEFRRICDSRMSSSFKNRFISTLLADTGKLGQIHLLTDQDWHAVDRRVRLNVDYILFPRILRKAKKKVCEVSIFDSYKQFRSVLAFSEVFEEWEDRFYYPIEPYYKFYDTTQHIADYVIRFTPKDYAEKFQNWLDENEYIKHPDFKLKIATLKLWKRETGEFISNEEISGLMEWLRYNTDLPMKGRAK